MSTPLPESLHHLIASVTDETRSGLDRLTAGAELVRGLEAWLPELAAQARSDEGESWRSIGQRLDITRQAAQQRFGGHRRSSTKEFVAPAQ